MTSVTGLSPSAAGLSSAIPLSFKVTYAVRTPPCTHDGLGSSGFARRYFRNRCFFLFLRLLRCFSSPGSPPCVMCWRTDTWASPMWVPPFRHLRIVRYLPLPAAFRSLSRLSSALSAKASALCPFCLTCRGARHAASCLRHAWAMPMPSFPSRPLPSFFAFHQIRSLFLSVWIFQGAALLADAHASEWRRRDSNS